jgi:hypothetical protein
VLSDVAAGTTIGRTEDEITRFATDMMLWSIVEAKKAEKRYVFVEEFVDASL